MPNALKPTRKGLAALEWLNFFLADVQTGLGPFVAAYLAASGWNPGSVGYALTFGGLTTVALQTPAGAVVDAARNKKLLLMESLGLLVAGAILLMMHPSTASIYGSQFLIGAAGPFLLPTVTAITLGMVGAAAFDRNSGKIKRSTLRETFSRRSSSPASATNSATARSSSSQLSWRFQL